MGGGDEIETQTIQNYCVRRLSGGAAESARTTSCPPLFGCHTGRCCQPQNRGTAQRNEQDYRGRLAAIVWYQRKSSQWGIFRQHSRSFIHCLCAQSDSAHSPAVKPCHYPLVRLWFAGDRPLLLLACVCIGALVCVCVCVMIMCVCMLCIYVWMRVFTAQSLCTYLSLEFALQAGGGQVGWLLELL